MPYKIDKSMLNLPWKEAYHNERVFENVYIEPIRKNINKFNNQDYPFAMETIHQWIFYRKLIYINDLVHTIFNELIVARQGQYTAQRMGNLVQYQKNESIFKIHVKDLIAGDINQLPNQIKHELINHTNIGWKINEAVNKLPKSPISNISKTFQHDVVDFNHVNEIYRPITVNHHIDELYTVKTSEIINEIRNMNQFGFDRNYQLDLWYVHWLEIKRFVKHLKHKLVNWYLQTRIQIPNHNFVELLAMADQKTLLNPQQLKKIMI